MQNPFTSPKFVEAQRNQQVAVLRGLLYSIPSPEVCWDLLVDTNEEIIKFDPKKDKLPRVFVSVDGHELPELRRVMNDWKIASRQISMGGSYSAHLYHGNDAAATIGVHQDYVDVVYWQLHGTVQWKVPKGGVRTHAKDMLVDSDQYYLRPGDAIYVPYAVRHRVLSMGERFGVSFGRSVQAYDQLMPEDERQKRLAKTQKMRRQKEEKKL